MSRRVKRRRSRGKIPANDRHRRMQRILGTFLLIVIAMILLFIGYNLLRPPAAGLLPADGALAENAAATGTLNPSRAAGKPKYRFYDELKKRHDEIEAEVREKLAGKKEAEIDGRNYCIQIGAFHDSNSAESVRARMILRDYPVQILHSGKVHLVQVGPYKNRDRALEIQKKLIREGLQTMLKTYVN